MTDAPGEWFQKWAINRDAGEAEGARWAAEHGDVFLLVADREALAGPERGGARTAIQLLARRLARELGGRPVALVWTKSDVSIPQETESAVRESVLRVMPEAAEFPVSIMTKPDGTEDRRGLLELLGWVLSARRARVRLREVGVSELDPFFRVGAR